MNNLQQAKELREEKIWKINHTVYFEAGGSTTLTEEIEAEKFEDIGLEKPNKIIRQVIHSKEFYYSKETKAKSKALKAKIEAEGCGKHAFAHLPYSNKCTNEDKDWEYWRCPECQEAIKICEVILK